MRHRIVLRSSVLALILAAAPGAAQVVEDFESYESTPDLAAVWEFATELDTTTPNPGSGTQSLRLEGDPGSFGGLFTTNTFDEPVDLSGLQVSIWLRRDPASVMPTSVSILLSDDSFGGCGPSLVPIADSAWRRMIVDIDECAGFDPTAVVSLQLAASNFTKADETVAMNFDDIGVLLFVGDFESGNTTRWTIAMP